ncbi:MFS transporter [bacterium]|nr:MFS transporter [bacterium]
MSESFMQTSDNPGPGKLSVLRKIGYGVGNVSYSLGHQVIASFFIFYATAILKIPPGLAGIIIAISAVWDGISDPLMGYLSDNTESRRFGRRHQYLLLGSLLIAVFSYLLWSIDPSADSLRNFWVVLFLVLAVKTGLTIYVVPYNAVGGELSTNYDERSSIQGYRAVFYMCGLMIAIGGSTIYFFRSTPEFTKGQLNPAAYPAIGIAFSIIILLAALFSFLATRKYIPHLPQRSSVMKARKISFFALWTDLKSSLRNRNILALVLMIFFIEVGFQLGIAIGFHVNTYTYNLTAPVIGILTLIIFLFSIVSQPFWLWVAKKLDKKKALLLSLIPGLIGFIGAPWTHVWWKIFPVDAPSLPYTLAMFFVFAGIGNGAFMSLPFSMVADAVDSEEVKTNKRDEGLFFGLYTLAYKLGTSLSLLASGIVLTATGFDPQLLVQSDSTKFNLAMVPTYFLLLLTPLAFCALWHYSIDRKTYQKIREVLGKRISQECE